MFIELFIRLGMSAAVDPNILIRSCGGILFKQIKQLESCFNFFGVSSIHEKIHSN
jgi:hypothetical protein